MLFLNDVLIRNQKETYVRNTILLYKCCDSAVFSRWINPLEFTVPFQLNHKRPRGNYRFGMCASCCRMLNWLLIPAAGHSSLPLVYYLVSAADRCILGRLAWKLRLRLENRNSRTRTQGSHCDVTQLACKRNWTHGRPFALHPSPIYADIYTGYFWSSPWSSQCPRCTHAGLLAGARPRNQNLNPTLCQRISSTCQTELQ